VPPIIRLDRVSKRFGVETALDEVTLEVPPGVVFALLGENGAGKTTAIRIMLGLAEPTSGQAEVLGHRSAAEGLRIRQRVGYVPERPTLYEWMTVEEIGWFTAGFYGPGFLPEYARLVAQFTLPPKKKLKSLSKGMSAKVVLALALAHQPELLILDEPTSGLDALVRREFLESMVDRAAEGQTVFLSSHQIVEVERVADVVAILRRGKLLLVEPLDQLKAQVRRLTVTLKDGAVCGAGVPPASVRAGETPAPQGVPGWPPIGEVLSQRWKPRQWQAIVRGTTDEQLAALRGHEAIDGVEVNSASLEDIFVAYMQD
jgi:ABC-2 type transport system ATP-binding protein